MPKTYTVNEVAEILGYSTNSIYTFLKEKRIKGVRVGRGRFRIPEEELNRVLHLKKSGVEQTSVTVPVVPAASTAASVPQPTLLSHASEVTADVSVPNMIDWLMGIAAIVSGAGLFLFNKTQVSYGGQLEGFLYGIRVALLGIGFGVVLTSMYKGFAAWKRVLYVLLAVVSFGSAWSFVRVGDFDGAILYGAMGIVVIVSLVRQLSGMDGMLMYLLSVTIGISSILFLTPTNDHVVLFSQILSVSPSVAGLMMVVGAGGNLLLYWIGYKKQSLLLWVGAWVSATMLALGATWYGTLELWSRALFLVVLSFFQILAPVWHGMAGGLYTKRERATTHTFFAVVTIFMLLGVFAIYQIQQVLVAKEQSEFHNKIGMGRRLIEHGMNSAKSLLLTTSVNQDFLTAVAQGNLPTLVQYQKVLYESHAYLRRLVVLSPEGKGMALYPLGTFDRENYAFREYFVAVRNTKKPYVSGVFEAEADGEHRQVVAIAVPLLGKNGTFLGVLVGSVNLEQLNVELQQIAEQQHGEAFTVVDQKGTYILTDTMSEVGKALAADDPMRAGIKDTSVRSREMYSYNGFIGAMTFDVIGDLQWGMKISVPMSEVMALNSMVSVLIIGTIMFFLILAVIVLHYLMGEKKRYLGGSS